MAWGTPTLGATLQNPSTCSASNIVYYNMNGNTIKLSGGSSGCGILLVDGDLDINGGFNWNGMVIVNGSITYTGGGDKNVTGAVLAGGSLDADLVGGNANIVYCSSAINNLTAKQAFKKIELGGKHVRIDAFPGSYFPHHPSGSLPSFFSVTSSVSL